MGDLVLYPPPSANEPPGYCVDLTSLSFEREIAGLRPIERISEIFRLGFFDQFSNSLWRNQVFDATHFLASKIRYL